MGQCDAISEEYELDFKLLDSQTKLMAVSILKEQPIVFASGLVAYTECKNLEERSEQRDSMLQCVGYLSMTL